MKKLSDGETVVLNVKIPADLDARIRQFQIDQNLTNRSDAARVALERGLNGATNGH